MRPIHIKKSHIGLLHKNMGVPKGQSLGMADLEHAEQGASPAMMKRLIFTENAKGWNRSGPSDADD